MVDATAEELHRFREKLDRELKSGVISLVLLLVVERTGPDYGYRILRTVQERSGGRLAFKEGTAYPLLQNLERMGFVSSYWGESESGPPRKYYQATELGRRALAQALDDWGALSASVDDVVRGLRPRKTKGGD
jgi:PadR family transcriptional regulator PadR